MDYTCVMLKALFLCLLPVNIHVSVAKQLPLNPMNYCAAARAYTCTKSTDQQTRTTVTKSHSTTHMMQSSE